MRLDRLLTALALLIGVVVATPTAAHADDTTPPVITIDSPLDGEELTRGDGITVAFGCVDETDPAPTCDGLLGGDSVPSAPIASGDGRFLEAAGTYTLTVTTM